MKHDLNVIEKFFELSMMIPNKITIENLQLGDELFDLCFNLRKSIKKELNATQKIPALSKENESIIENIKKAALKENIFTYSNKEAIDIFIEFIDCMKKNNDLIQKL